MKRYGISLVVVMTIAGLLMEGQSQAAPAPTAPVKALELAQAAAPAKKGEFPIPGKPVTIIVPYAAGGGTSVAALKMASLLEKSLKTPFQVVNRPGAGTQIGLTELARSKPDGYTIGYGSFPVMAVIYLDPTRKAVFTRKSFQPIAPHFATAVLINVLASSPYKTLKDLIDAARAQPGKITIGTIGMTSPGHLGVLLLEKAAGVKFNFVHFDGDAPAANALLGRHVDITPHSMTGLSQHIKSGAVRVLGILDTEESPQLPGVKTLASQGYNVQLVSTNGLHAPAGTPPEVVTILTQAIQKAQSDQQHRKEMEDFGFTLRYMDPEQYEAFEANMETQVKPLLQEIRPQK